MENLEQLIEDCKAGKQSAQSQLYKAYASVLYGVCLRYARDETEAEDTLHEGFVTIFNKVNQFAGKGSFEGWMKRIMVNIALEKYRKRYRLHTVEDITVYDYKTVNEDVYANINAKELMQLVRDLPPRYRMVFNMYAIDGYNHKEIAEEMGIAEGTSKSNLARARKILQDKIIEMSDIDKVYAK